MYGCCSMNLYSSSVEKDSFEKVLINYNDAITYEGYRLINWTNEEIDTQIGNIAISNIRYAKCEKAGFLKSAVVNYLQTSNNSVAKIKNTMIEDREFGYPIGKDVLQLHTGSALGCELVGIGAKHYIIVTYVDYCDNVINLPLSVYEINLSEQQVDTLIDLKGDNELYKRNFPTSLTHYYATPKLIIISYTFLFCVAVTLTFGLGKIKARKQSAVGTGKQ